VLRGWAELYTDPDPARVERAFAAMLQMKKLDIVELQHAVEGSGAPAR